MSETSGKNRRRRWWLWALAALAAGALAIVIALPMFVDAELFRPQIERVLRDTTGWDAELGSIELSVLRGALGVSPAGLTAPGGETSKIDVERIDVEVGLLALLRRELHVRSIRLVRPEALLVRPDEATGWVLPTGGIAADGAPADGTAAPTPSPPGEETSTPAAGSQAPSRPQRGFSVVIEEIALRDGTVRLIDRVAEPDWTLVLNDVSASFYPDSGDLEGRFEVGDGDGATSWRGRLNDTIEISLDGLKTDLLQPLLGPDLIHPGGKLFGTVRIATPLRVDGDLRAEGLTAISGERPFDDATLAFAIAPTEAGWRLENLDFRAGEARLTGAGELTPALHLDLELPETPLEEALRASESVLPLPLDVRPPGSVDAAIRVDQPEGGELTYEVSGGLRAAEVRPGDALPPARDVRAAFTLDRGGRLDVTVDEGTVAGGSVRGEAVIGQVYPPGRLEFSGGLKDAVFGELLGGMVEPTQPVKGPTGFDARLGVDLTRDVLDARSLSGSLDFRARDLSLPGWDLDGAVRGKLEEKLGSGTAGLIEGLLNKDDDEKSVSASGAADKVRQLIDSLQGTVDFDRWPWGLRGVQLAVGDVASEGEGWFNPEDGSVDFTLTSRLAAAESSKLVEKHRVLKSLVDRSGRLTLPVRVKGSLTAPSVRVDLEGALKDNLLDDGGGKKEVEGLLRGLLGRDKKKKKD